jgi:phosphoribosylglycinamide formyltransferase-1
VARPVTEFSSGISGSRDCTKATVRSIVGRIFDSFTGIRALKSSVVAAPLMIVPTRVFMCLRITAADLKVDYYRSTMHGVAFMRIGFLASNNGRAMRAIIAAIEGGALCATAAIVVSNRKQSSALAFAEQHRIPALWIPTLPDEDAADERLCEVMLTANVQIIVLSGYLRQLGPKTLGAFQNRVLNTHPALLPKFGGPGMYGRRVHEAVLAAREQTTGATIHLVNGEYDHGCVVAQREVTIDAADDPDSLMLKVMQAEGALFVEVLRQIAEGNLRLGCADKFI